MSIEIHQFSCREGGVLDLRQARALLRHRPDIVFWEAPSMGNKAVLVFDKNKSIKEQEYLLREKITHLSKIAKKYRWVLSDVQTYKNAIILLRGGHKLNMYNVDGPPELLRETIQHGWNKIEKPRHKGRHLLWWVYIYLRERIMANKLSPFMSQKNVKALMFMQKFHWVHVHFLLSSPSKEEIWEYYFGAFPNMNMENILEVLKGKNRVLYKYWMKYSDFV